MVDYSTLPGPFRLRVLRAISAELKTIRPSNGFVHDLGDELDEDGAIAEHVLRGITQLGKDDPLPALTLLEDTRAAEDGLDADGSATMVNPWRLCIMGFVDDSGAHPTDAAHYLVAEVIQVLADQKRNASDDLFGMGDFEPCITGIHIGQPLVRPAEAGVSDVAFFFLPFTLDLVEDLENPFA